MKPKTDLQKQINKDIKKINPNINVFESIDFEKNEDAKELQRLYSINQFEELEKHKQKESNMDALLMDIAYYMIEVKQDKFDLIRKITNSNFNDDELDKCLYYEENEELSHRLQDINATAEFFGLEKGRRKEDDLLAKITDPIYYKALNPSIKDREVTVSIEGEEYTANLKDANLEELLTYKTNIQKWVQYCKRINLYKTYINEKYPRWSKYTNKEKKDHINTFKELIQAPFINDMYLNELIHFIENYSLNQDTKVKAQKLLDYKFKNVDDIKTATEIYKKSNLKFNP